jgi:hypothetical protein
MPRKRVLATANASTPPGWSYNPSSWSERLPLVGLALVGFAIAISLTVRGFSPPQAAGFHPKR